jgi:thioesterase domain-containing protein/acyl carrier protein
MLPPQFVFMDALPLTANNKVDIKRLSEPAFAEQPSAASPAQPANPLELRLTALWQQVLRNDSIGIHDNFFEIGGHSLKAVELFAYVHEVFGKKLPLATLFRAPTIAQLAQVLADDGWEQPWRSLVAIQPKGRAVPFFAVPGVGGNVLVFAKLATLFGHEQPFFGLQPRGLNGAEPFTSIEAAARYYIAEIRSVRPQGPYFIGGTCTGGVYAYEMAQQLMAQGEKVTLVLLEVFHPSSYPRTGRTAALLWPTNFLWSKLILYLKDLTSLPLREWGTFLGSKARRATAALFQTQPTEIRADGSFASARLIRTTLQAVAAYKPEPYPGSMLNVIASGRSAYEGPDTRMLWAQLAHEPSQTFALPAEDSGRLFVSPHVEQLAQELARYARAEIPPTPTQPRSTSVETGCQGFSAAVGS